MLNPSHPYTVDVNNDKASFIFADGVDYAIEIKPDVSNKAELERALLQIQSVKRLRRIKHGVLFENRHPKELVESLKTVPGVIVSDKSYDSPRTLVERIYDFYKTNAVPPIEQFDLLLVNNCYLLYNFRPNSYIASGDAMFIAYGDYKEKSIAAFLYELNIIPHCEPIIGDNVMKLYLEGIRTNMLRHYTDLDEIYIRKTSAPS